MKIIRIFIILALTAAWFAPAALAARHPSAIDNRLFGLWEAYEPATNAVQFDMNQNMRIYLTREEGTRMNLRWIDGPFTLTSNNTIRLRYEVGRKRHYRTFHLSFKSDDELWLTENGRVTKYRRQRGELSERFNWR